MGRAPPLTSTLHPRRAVNHMSATPSDLVIREELRARVHRLLDRRGKQVDSYGRPSRPHLMLDVDGIEMHRDDFGMSVYVAGQPIYTEVQDERCTSFQPKKVEEVVARLRKLTILDDLSDSGK